MNDKTKFPQNNKMDEPTFVSRDGMLADKEYVEWLKELKARYRQSQAKASVKVNTFLLEYYWSLGRDIVQRKAESKWGSGFFNQLSLDMRAMFPDEKGFSVTNLKYIKRWYVFYYEQFIIRHQAGDEFGMPEIFGIIPWKHHVNIFTKSKSIEEALFYINKTATEGWSRARLEHEIDAHLFLMQGAAITNFDKTLPVAQSESAKELLKKEYDLSFVTVEAVEQEKDLENALAKNVTEFLLELGQGFAYLGRQRELRMDNESVFFPICCFITSPNVGMSS